MLRYQASLVPFSPGQFLTFPLIFHFLDPFEDYKLVIL